MFLCVVVGMVRLLAGVMVVGVGGLVWRLGGQVIRVCGFVVGWFSRRVRWLRACGRYWCMVVGVVGGCGVGCVVVICYVVFLLGVCVGWCCGVW